MTRETDHISVPTNGRGPHPVDPPTAADAGVDEADEAIPSPIPMSSGQLIVGFGVIASLILLVLRRRRGRDRTP